MKRRMALALSLGLAVMAAATTSPAQEPEPQFQRHPHMLVVGLQFDETGEPVSFRRCVDLAGNRALRLNAQHLHMHFGIAGEKLLANAGHLIVPGAPFPEPFFPAVPWSNCEELIAFFFGG